MRKQRLMRIITTAAETGRRSDLPSCRNCGDRRASQLQYLPGYNYGRMRRYLTVRFRCKSCGDIFERADWLTKHKFSQGEWFEVQEDLKGDQPLLFHLSRRPARLPASPTEGA